MNESKMNPRADVVVLMPVYNGSKHLLEAVQSILGQTYTNFELLIINDCSDDASEQIIQSIRDLRIRYIRNPRNLGLPGTLNKGIMESPGCKYIARMDQDDISLPHRLETQIRFMDENPAIGVSGSWIRMFGETSYINKYFTEHEELKAKLLFNTCFAHPTVVFRTSILKNGKFRYDEADKGAEDYGLWVSLVDEIKLANLGEVLLNYRVHPENMSKVFSSEQASSADRYRKEMLARIGLQPNEDDFFIHKTLQFDDRPQDNIGKADLWLHKIIERNSRNHYFDGEKLLKIIKYRWLGVCDNHTNLRLWVWKRFWQSDFSRGAITTKTKLSAGLLYNCLKP